MADLKENFREWLSTQKFSQNTINQYIRRIDKICYEIYKEKKWNFFTEDAPSLLAMYTELANKGYLLDYITTEYALNYFNAFFTTIKSSNNPETTKVELFIYSNKENYFINSVNFNDLQSYLNILNAVLYHKPLPEIRIPFSRMHEFKADIINVLENNPIKNTLTSAIRITYKQNHTVAQTALSKYCAFLQTTNPSNASLAKQLAFVRDIKEKNPNKTVNNHYEVVQQISGMKPLQIKAVNERDRLDIYFTITKQDLTKIFNLDKDTVTKLIANAKLINNHDAEYDEDDYTLAKNLIRYCTKEDIIVEFETEIRIYYNDDNINAYLKKHHHYHDRLSTIRKKNIAIGVTEKKHWRFSVLEKKLFYRRAGLLTYIDYTSYTTKYYIPELKIIKDFPDFKRIRRRNNKPHSIY